MAEESKESRIQVTEVSEVACSLEIFVTKCLATKMLWRPPWPPWPRSLTAAEPCLRT